MAVYHGSNRKGLTNEFGNFDLIITTYETVRTECAAKEENGSLFSWKWLRVVLDEAHHIRNHESQTFRSVYDLVSIYRWCLTATPIHNCLDDYGSLLEFIRVFPFMNRPKFRSWIVKPVEEKHPLGIERLRALIRATCLRRMKAKVLSSDEIRLPPRLERLHEVNLHQDDQIIYDIVKQICAEKAARIDNRSIGGSPAKSKDKNLLALINSLRLICDHGEHLLPETVKELLGGAPVGSFNSGMMQVGSDCCSVCEGEIDNSTLSSDQQMPICIDCAASEEGSQSMNLPSDLDGKEMTVCRPSAKVLALLDNLNQQQVEARRDGQPRKSVVFSYWVKMLDLVGKALQKENVIFQRINGQKTLEERQAAMQEFNDNPDCTVLLASIGSSTEGVNLTAANTVHLLEPHWNPMVEVQAVDRVHRIGQTQEVTVIRYIVPKSIETYVQRVQQEKVQLVNSAVNADEVTEAELDTQRWKGLRDILK
ncbi:P-loop containing nucleoside triphosphate hydrolase protein [Hypoxylon argillaceum]|nr:P-loop containing nucleoside triphosphate hydrolase protein [Hypoxylon argillaceum]